MRLLQICEFLEPLVDTRDPVSLQAYAPELLEEIKKSLPFLEAEGTAPDFFERILALLGSTQGALPDLFDDEDWKQMNARLSSLSKNATSFVEQRRTNGVLKHGSKGWGTSCSVWVPVVETEPFLTKHAPSFARLLTFTMDLARRHPAANEDALYLDQIVDPDGQHHRVIRRALDAARALVEKETGRKAYPSYHVHCRFSGANAVFGESLGLGAAAAAFCELLRDSDSRKKIIVSSRVAFTGALGEDRIVLAVDESALRLKLEACLYSRIHYIVVPKVQLEIAEGYFAERKRGFGAGDVPVVVGVEKVDEVIYDRRLTQEIQVPLRQLAAQRIWKRRRPIASLLILGLSLALGYRIISPIDKNPRFAELRDKWLVVKNARYEVLGQYDIGTRVARQAEGQDYELAIARTCQFYDVDHDGINEVFYRSRRDEDSTEWCISCQSVREGGIHWQATVSRQLVFPKKSDVAKATFSIVTFVVGDFEGTGRPEVILVANHTFFPSLIVKLDARTGQELGSYLHVGQLADVAATDLDGDGVAEIIACGVNNAFRKAAVLVLDPRRIEGCSPTAGDYVPDPYVPARERWYLLIPRTIAGDAVRDLSASNGALSVMIDRDAKRIAVAVSDYQIDLPRFDMSATAKLVYYFDFDLHPLRVGTSTPYDLLAERMVRLGWIQKVPDKTYFDSCLNSIWRWRDGARQPG